MSWGIARRRIYGIKSIDSVCGPIESGWTADAAKGSLKTYDATVPANTTAVLYLPMEDGTAGTEQEIDRNNLPEGVTWCGRQMHLGRACGVFRLASGSYHFEL